jgi:hypothetical protein
MTVLLKVFVKRHLLGDKTMLRKLLKGLLWTGLLVCRWRTLLNNVAESAAVDIFSVR